MSFTIPFPKYDLIQHIAAFVCYGVSLIMSSSILLFEYNKRRKIRNDQQLKILNTTLKNKSLSYHSLFALICCPMISITGIMIKIPVICSWPMYPIVISFWICVQIFLTLYQIARLKYCFSAKNSLKYGYSNQLFFVLNIYGIVILLYCVFALFEPNYTIYSSQVNGRFGCKYESTQYYSLLVGIFSAMFYIWDWFVLILYIIKIVQFQRKQKENNSIVYKKVLFILQKILLLTIIYEITGGIVIFFHGQTQSNFIWALSASLDATISSSILFLMIEHNNDYYVKIIQTLNGYYLCFCCKSLIKDVIEHELQDVVENKGPTGNEGATINIEDTIHETRDISTKCIAKDVSMMESELTITNYKQQK